MKKNNFKYLSILLIFLFGLICSCNNNYYLTQTRGLLNRQKESFGKESTKENLLSHFPKRIKNDSAFLRLSEPSCPPTYKCSAQFGDVILFVNKSDYQKELSEILSGEITYETNYLDSNIIVNLLELRRNIFPIEKCNKWYANKLPIPYFENYDFGLGTMESKKEEEGKLHFNYTHTIPIDLQVYVIKAEAGDFWKESCNEKRPESLKEWRHGYSKGFAISEKENMIIYWTMIW